VPDFGPGILVTNHQVKKVISTYTGENREFSRQFYNGEIECEFVPFVMYSIRYILIFAYREALLKS